MSKRMPNETLVYFGDTAHHPYGEKSPDNIQRYAIEISDFLVNEVGCKALVIACNTASAVAYQTLRDKYKGILPVINVIDPVVESVIANDSLCKIGIIATQRTIDSGVYQEKLNRRKPSLQLRSKATPLLAPMIEEGFGSDKMQETILYEYLDDAMFNDIDALVLGCTHYPLIRHLVEGHYKGRVAIFDSTSIVAEKLHAIMQSELLLNQHQGNKTPHQHRFYVSDFTSTFELSAKRFYGKSLHFKEQPL